MDIDNDESYLSDNSSVWKDSTSEDDSECENEEMNNVRVWCRAEPNILNQAHPAFPFVGSPDSKYLDI